MGATRRGRSARSVDVIGALTELQRQPHLGLLSTTFNLLQDVISVEVLDLRSQSWPSGVVSQVRMPASAVGP